MRSHPSRITIDRDLLQITATRYSVSLAKLAIMLDINHTDIHIEQLCLSQEQPQQLISLKELMDLAELYFASEIKANIWMRSFNLGLNSIPLDLCDSACGIKRVKNSLNKLLHGITA